MPFDGKRPKISITWSSQITLTLDTLFGREYEVETALPTTVGRIQARTQLGMDHAALVGQNSRSRGDPMRYDIGTSLPGYEASTVEDAMKHLLIVGKWVNRLGNCFRYSIPEGRGSNAQQDNDESLHVIQSLQLRQKGTDCC